MRLLPIGADHVCRGHAGGKAQTHECRHRYGDVRKHLPLWNVPAHPARHSPRSGHSGTGRCEMSAIVNLSRRGFFKAGITAGGGLLLGFHVPVSRRWAIAATVRSEQATLNSWVRIARDGTVTVIVGQSEMGQGIMTAIPMIIADELEADWSKVRSEQAPANPAYGDPMRGGEQSTNGSRSIRNMLTLWRQAGAAAREMLVAACADGRVPCGTKRGDPSPFRQKAYLRPARG